MNETKRNETKRNEHYYLLTNLLSFKLFIILLSFILLFSISCSSDENPTSRGIGYYAGAWYDRDNPTDEVIVINSDGSITINDETTGSANITDITKNSDTNYSFYYGEQKDNSSGTEITIKVKFTLNFSSDTEGTITIIGEGTLPDGTTISVPSGTYNIIKK